ncbi:MAG: hypothetical protein AAF497_18645 [Planctomycetota bacterium]
MGWCSKCNRESSDSTNPQESTDLATCVHCGAELKEQAGTSERLTLDNKPDWEMVADLRRARARVDGFRAANEQVESESTTSRTSTTRTPSTSTSAVTSGSELPDQPNFWAPFIYASIGLTLGFAATFLAESSPIIFPVLLVVWVGFGIYLTLQSRRTNEPTNNQGVPTG